MKTIAVFNLKGGCGKTTTATSLAAILRHKGYRVLLIDADAQRDATRVFRGVIEDEYTLYNVLGGGEPCGIKDAIQHQEFGDILPADQLLDEWVEDMKFTPTAEFLLDRQVRDLKDDYDFVIIDTHPSKSLIETSVLIASDYVLIPGPPEAFTAEGTLSVYNKIMDIRKSKNPRLKVLGFLVCRYKKNINLHREGVPQFKTVIEALGARLFNTTIRESAPVGYSQAAHMPLIDYDKRSDVEKDYEAFADEFLEAVRKDG